MTVITGEIQSIPNSRVRSNHQIHRSRSPLKTIRRQQDHRDTAGDSSTQLTHRTLNQGTPNEREEDGVQSMDITGFKLLQEDRLASPRRVL